MNHYVLPELLVPAGGQEQLEAALLYGADAVYLGGAELSLRTACSGFAPEALSGAVKQAHAAGVRVYYCLNAMPYDVHLGTVSAMLERLPDAGVDGVIIADPGVLWLARQYCPTVPVHLSTQAHTVNRASVAFWQEAGVERVNLAREVGARSMRQIIQACPGMDFEVFVHGAMCLALSGHCLLSAWVNNRPANLGRCTQPCRFEYRGLTLGVEEQKRQGELFWEIQQDEAFSAFWAPHDLCLVRFLPWIAASGVKAVKVEGRTKSGGYVAQVTDVYRTALNRCAQGSLKGALITASVDELMLTASRPLSSGFFLPRRKIEARSPAFQERPVVARVLGPAGQGGWQVQVRAPWSVEREAAVLVPGMSRPVLRPHAYTLENHKGERVDRLHPGTTGVLHCEETAIAPGLYIRA